MRTACSPQAPYATLLRVQVVLSFDEEGGIAKMVSNKPAVTPDGQWVALAWHIIVLIVIYHSPCTTSCVLHMCSLCLVIP